MRRPMGRTDYGSDITPLHPFYLRCSRLNCKDFSRLSSRVKRWQWLAGISTGLILFNSLLMFWLAINISPVVFVDTVLPSGKLYQQGILVEKAMDKHAGRKILTSLSLNKSGFHTPISYR